MPSDPHAAEAQRRWGHTPEWEQSQRVDPAVGAERRAAAHTRVLAALEKAAAEGLPTGAEAARVVADHLESISGFYEVTPARQVILARMYCQDERFNATYGGRADLLRELVEREAASASVALDDVRW